MKLHEHDSLLSIVQFDLCTTKICHPIWVSRLQLARLGLSGPARFDTAMYLPLMLPVAQLARSIIRIDELVKGLSAGQFTTYM